MHVKNYGTTGSLFETDLDAAARLDAIDFVHAYTALYTVRREVNRLLDQVGWPGCGGRLVDASCGDGSVLSVALDRLLASAALNDEDVAYHVQGYEMHEHAAAEARATVAAVLVQHGRTPARAREVATRIVHHLDFLTDGPMTPTFDLHVGNPPYMRMVNVPEPLRSDYLRVVPAHARHDMLFSFLDRCASTLLPGGTMGFVLSDRFLFNKTAADLRQHLGPQLSVSHVERLDAASAFNKPKLRRKGTPPRVHPVMLVLGTQGRPLTREPIYPDAPLEAFSHLPTLGELATIRLAPYLGQRGIFYMPLREARVAGIPPQDLVPVVEPRDVSRGIMAEPRLVAIRTRAGVRPCDAILQHLEHNRHRMTKRELARGWLPRESFEGWDLDAPSLVVPRAVQTPVATRIRPGVLPIGHDLSIVTATPAALDMIERAIHKPVAAGWLRAYAPPICNGYHALDPDLLRKMPIDRRRVDREPTPDA